LHVQGPSPSSPSRGGFTLIELIAVVAMFALVAALVLPTFDVGRRREVRQAGERVGDAVELARQRAIMTGRTHRVLLDLDGSRYAVEWQAPVDPEALAAEQPPAAAGSRRVAMEPPPEVFGPAEFVPVPGPFGRPAPLGDDVVFFDVVFPDTIVNTGVVELRLGPDGATDPALVTIADVDDRWRVEVEVQALADAVRVADVPR